MSFTRTLALASALAVVAGCGSSAPAYVDQAMERLLYSYITAYENDPSPKTCLPAKQLDGKHWVTLCGINNGGKILGNAGLWEIREENGTWTAYASNGKAARSQEKFIDPQIKPPQYSPTFDITKARDLFR